MADLWNYKVTPNVITFPACVVGASVLQQQQLTDALARFLVTLITGY